MLDDQTVLLSPVVMSARLVKSPGLARPSSVGFHSCLGHCYGVLYCTDGQEGPRLHSEVYIEACVEVTTT